MIDAIRAGDRRALARAATLVERRQADRLLQDLFQFTGRACVWGITGAAGVGKSTLTDAITAALRGEGLSVAILAIDPSSPFTGGAILGDRVRMGGHFQDAGVFIRSMATRGAIGGLAAAASDMVLLLDAAGFDYVLVETVGVGQDEVDIAGLADRVAVVLAPGLGDGVQAMKAGLLEIASVLVINKADREGAEALERDLHSAEPSASIVRTIASSGDGVSELISALRNASASLPAPARWRARLRSMVSEKLLEKLSLKSLDRAAAAVAGRELDPYTAVHGLLGEIVSSVRD
jgi:LAO/AO transport system kinase